MKNLDTARRNGRDGERGFTILETLVAIAILLIATTGPMVFAQQSLRAARLARDHVTAFYLAQDAIEFVKHVRDDNSINTPPLTRAQWLDGLEDCYADSEIADDGCTVSVPEWDGDVDEVVAPCATLESCAIRSRNGLYGTFLPTDEGTRFSRRLRILTAEGEDPAAEEEEVLIEVEVEWTTLGISGTRSVLVREYIYNWIN